MEKAALTKKKTLSTNKLKLKEELSECCNCRLAFYGVENWTLWKYDQTCVASSVEGRRRSVGLIV
jgi:hypothetical protein